MTETIELPDAGKIAELAAVGMLPSLYARLKPDAVAIYGARSQRTFAELNGNANRIVAALARAGVTAGDHIALLCGNTPEFVEVLAAGWRSGLRLTPINWHLSPPEVAYIVSDCRAKALIAHADFAAAATASLNDNLKCKLAIGGPIDGFESYEAALAARKRRRPGASGARQHHDVHLGHDRAGPRASIAPAPWPCRRPGARARPRATSSTRT